MADVLRVYGGVQGGDRRDQRRAQLIDAGLEMLGNTATLTVRGVCKQSGLAARYFYENFADRDALARAVFDHVVDELARATLAAVRHGDARERIHRGLATMVRMIAADPRKGRLLFSAALADEVFAQRRLASSRLFARLLGEQAAGFYGAGPPLELTAQFVVGGFGQVLTAWLDGTVTVTEDELVDHCTELFLRIAGPAR